MADETPSPAPPPPSRLGRGLSAITGEVAGIRAGTPPAGGGFLRVPLADLRHPENPREANPELIESVRRFGVLQPLLVAREGITYRLLAGSRRAHAAAEAGLADIPAIIIPPERAGDLDVFIEENLTRSDLAESERQQLRTRWASQGRDPALAEQRIPDPVWAETRAEERVTPAAVRVWMIAAGILSIACVAMFALLATRKPVDRRPVVIPVEFLDSSLAAVAAPAPEPVPEPALPDREWMNAFHFPVATRTVHGEQLTFTLAESFGDSSGLSARGRLTLYQFAAMADHAPKPIELELSVFAPATVAKDQPLALAARLLAEEGYPSGRIAMRLLESDTPGFSMTLQPTRMDATE